MPQPICNLPADPTQSLPAMTQALGMRALDIGVSLPALVAMVPAVLLLLAALPVAGVRVRLQARELLGKAGRPFKLTGLIRTAPGVSRFEGMFRLLQAIPVLCALLNGRMALVGPRAVPSEHAPLFGGIAHPRLTVKPGLVCLWWLRRRGNIDYGTEAEADLEYVRTRSLRSDLCILVRALVALVYGPAATRCCAANHIAGIRLLNLSLQGLLDAISGALQSGTRTRIAFVNPDCVNVAARNPDYRHTLDQFDWVCADGIGMKIAGQLLGRPIRQNLNGTDLFPALCASLAASGHSLFLLGARNGVAEAAARWAVARHPDLIIAGTRNGYFEDAEQASILGQIRASGASVLLVAMGAPRQEQWLLHNLSASGAIVGIGVGGLFDFYSGRIPRAPQWLREMGGEWIYRLLQEPGRMWRRYLLGNWIFIARILVEKLCNARFKEKRS